MVLRLMEVYVSGIEGQRVKQILEDRPTLGIWYEETEEGETLVRILLPVEETEGVLDLLDQHLSKAKGFRVLLLSVEATLPRPEAPEEKREEEKPTEPEEKVRRISREELYADVSEASQLTRTYILLVALSSVVGAIGILRNDIIIIIGAMVIAPLLGPNAALALASTLGDFSLARRALVTSAVGIMTAVMVGIVIGLVFEVSPEFPQIAFRTRVDLRDILLALAAGSAGAIAFTIVLPAVIVGVMVAVALLPPLVTFGMLLGSGHFDAAMGTLLLITTYLVGINLAGVTTFLAQGIRPMTWWEAEKAKRATRISIATWAVLLLILIAAILLAPR